MTRSRAWVVAGLVGFLPGGLVATLMLYVAWQHNPQGEFYEGSVVHWGSWLGVGASWFVVIGVPTALFTRLVLVPFTAPRGPNEERESPG